MTAPTHKTVPNPTLSPIETARLFSEHLQKFAQLAPARAKKSPKHSARGWCLRDLQKI
jgi:hypothetical protein